MINQVEEKFKTHPNYPIVSLESGGMIGVVAPTSHPARNTAQQPPRGKPTVSFVCLGLGAILGAAGVLMMVANETARVQADAKLQISKAQDTAAIAQWRSQEQQKQIDDFCLQNKGPLNGKN